jgi:Holliday junction resolvasome RuvABC ATP-dependent DNA helicase subunit
MFDKMIGQEHIKSTLNFYVKGKKAGGVIPPILLTGARGLGKTQFSREFGKSLKLPILEINCSTIKNVSQFMEQIFIPVVMNNEIVLIFDESHALPKDLQNAFLTVFNTEQTPRKNLEWEGSSIEFDFTKQVYLFATTEPDKIFAPLKDRFEEIDFRPYSGIELEKILQKQIDWVTFSQEVCPLIIKTLRGNARSAVKRAKQIALFCESKNINKFDMSEWKSLCGVLGIQANGLTNAEIQVLQILKTRGSCTLAMLSAATGLSRSCIQRDSETHLLRMGFLKIDGQRKITDAGIRALATI